MCNLSRPKMSLQFALLISFPLLPKWEVKFKTWTILAQELEHNEELVKIWNMKMPIEHKQKHQKLNYTALIV